MCDQFSESGQPCGFVPCEAYKRLGEENQSLGNRLGLLEAENEALRHSSEYLAAELSGILRRFGYITTSRDGMEQFKKNLVSILQRATDLQQENTALRQELDNLKSGHCVRESIEELEDMDHLELVGCYMATAGLLVAANHGIERLRRIIVSR